MTVTADEIHLDYAAMEAVKTATHVAIIKRCQQIDPMHLLAGLAAAEKGIVHETLDQRRITYQFVKDSIASGQHPFEGNSRPPSKQLTDVINAARQLALSLSCSRVHAEHLLLALLDQYEVREFLQQYNANPAGVRSEVHQQMYFAELGAAVPGLQEALTHLQTAHAVLSRWGPPAGHAGIQDVLNHANLTSNGLEQLL